jgi:hypothetical protein
MRRGWLALVPLLVALTSCGGGEDSLTVYRLADPRFSLGVPESWSAITRDDLRETGALERFVQDNPAVAETLQGALDPGSPLKFFAVDPEVERGFVTNVNVAVQRVPTGWRLSDAARSSAAELSGIEVVRDLQWKEISLPAGPAVRITYRLQVQYGAATRSVATLQYLLLDEGKSYVVTYSTLPDLESEYASTFEDSAESLRLGS